MINKLKLATLIALVAFVGGACKKDFASINTPPSVVTTPDVKYLFTYSQERIFRYQAPTEWVYENMEQLMRYTQYVSTSPFEYQSVNSRYGTYYLSILPNLFEIRKQIDAKPDKNDYQYMAASTYIMQVLFGIKVTDMNGSIPYSQAEQGRYEAKYGPVYDNQDQLFTTWLSELDNAIATLTNTSLTNQQSYGNNDIYYKSDWTKWVKLANTLKLRIAARIENQNSAKAKQIFQQVMQNSVGPITTDDAQLSYASKDYAGMGSDINYRAVRYGSTSIIKFLKNTADPRLFIYFSSNDLKGSYKDTLTKYNVNLPAFVNSNDPLISYQGAPADWTTDTTSKYISTPVKAGTQNYYLISTINRPFFSPTWNGAKGLFTDIPVTNAESCLLIAEFIQKGYGEGVNTKGTAEDWYKKGVTSSIKTMNAIAVAALSTVGYTTDGTSEIAAYLNNPQVKFNGVNDLERIYIQQYLNLFRNANEAFVFCRRTGYPKKVSTYYARETYTTPIPRRWWLGDPGEVNRSNWANALKEQGFTQNAQDVQTLSTERVWYDKTAPNFGEGK
ncbi:SusD/RagB family nutrient-binding outer membrane lipoprotein [Chitinophagaceae bacterium LB-8]|uniref:SusD/RagB family nutrient-binding outer membrane lipoprotein n=1 Tax=Paraflavisolibacter caeni TaxID=2982496 RepID=A0A9X2XY99_9BACT|nr:SusD/RagB family nutrient-binding outer membrane lipoprotein [Paraflavisolibacter caeni]MCU7550960.1 SusD/RagB family nutrient-binding outer membrane lipoprotein [Paraflavisolibacter caeni]